MSDSVSVWCPSSACIDCSRVLLHRFSGRAEHALMTGRPASSLSAPPFPLSPLSSSLTTISGLAAMMFMQFRIGFDLGLVLIKAILL